MSTIIGRPLLKFIYVVVLGAIIGIPRTINYKSVDDIPQHEMKLCGEKVEDLNHFHEVGQSLMNSLVLSEKAKNFMIAREIQYTNSMHLYGTTYMFSGMSVLAYTTGWYAGAGFKLKKIMKRWGRGMIYSGIGIAYGVLFKWLYDIQQCRRDKKADRKAAALGPDYMEGGIEYYTKVLNRNMALRKLMGEEGAKMYTIYGNKVARWSDPTVQLTARRDLLINSYKERLEKEKEAREKAREEERKAAGNVEKDETVQS